MEGHGKPGVACPRASPMAVGSLHVGISRSGRGLPCEWVDVFSLQPRSNSLENQHLAMQLYQAFKAI